MCRFIELLVLVQSGCEAWVTRRGSHTTIESGACSPREAHVSRKVTGVAVLLLLSVWEVGIVKVAYLVTIVHDAQISLLSDNLSILVTTMTGMLFLNIISFDAAMRVCMVLSCVEHGVSILHHECLLRLCIATLIRVSRAVRIYSGGLPHDQVDNTATVDDPTDFLLSMSEKLTLATLHGLSDLALPEFLICFVSSAAEISIEHPRNEL